MSKRTLFQESFTAKMMAKRQKSVSATEKANEEIQAELRASNPIIKLDDAISVIEKIVNGVQTGYELIPWKQYAKNWETRSLIFCEFEVLCLSNTTQDAGWAVCRHVRNGLCTPRSGTKRYRPKIGNGGFHRHVEKHASEKKSDTSPLVVVSKDKKRAVTDAAAIAVALDLQPLSFCQHKVGMTKFAEALIELGQSFAPSVKLNVAKALPCGNTVRSGLIDLSNRMQLEFNTKLPSILEMGGGVTCDGVKLETNGKKYFDFVLNYLKFFRRPIAQGGGIGWEMCTRLLFITPHVGSETAELIRDNINCTLKDVTGLTLESFEKTCTFITDCASTMPKVFGSSVSPNKVPYSHRWAGCITHQLNTVMKSTIESEIIKSSQIMKDLTVVKSVVGTVKHASLNDEMPDGYALIQEVPTRFGTVYDVVERFLKSVSTLKQLVSTKAGDSAKKIDKQLSLLITSTISDGSITYPALQAIVTCLSPLRHSQTVLEASQKPTMHHVLPIIEELKGKLRLLSSGVPIDTTQEPPHELTQQLSKQTLAQLSNIRYHDVWCASCFLHPGLSSFHFMPSDTASKCRSVAESLVRKMISGRQDPSSATELHTSEICSLGKPIHTAGNCLLGSASWNLSDRMSFLTVPKKSTDELTNYICATLSEDDIDLLKTDEGIISFWVCRRESFPVLSRCALQLFVTPASSTPSERNFSLLKLIVTPGRNMMKDDIINATAKVRSALMESKQ